ncbi:TetR/AcrR family transcriptional regulator [Rhodococcus sp. WS3]|uniref:TetR/AcrR family transcriptional regulator n=1 Tax=Rhodococcus sp. WS3 TaxID=2486271 RepID=UPI001143E04E|nr:TetR/AcrR family transcriptional regulator [Rhodococcus sp. WS3]ROZ42526.1 TetR/AcrR family transcriptional regulator [Rhodococcus sp. WS3]
MAKRIAAGRSDSAPAPIELLEGESAKLSTKSAGANAAPPTTTPNRPARVSLRDAQRAVTRTRLMAGAMDVFADTTYPAATVDEIAIAAGVGRATFYLHFRSKLDLLQAIMTDATPEILSYFERADLAFATGDTAGVEAWVRDGLTYFEKNRTLMFVLDEVLATERAEYTTLFNTPVEFSDCMPLLMSNWPSERRSEASARIRLMALMLNRTWLSSSGLTNDQLVKMLADICVKAVCPPTVPPATTAGHEA